MNSPEKPLSPPEGSAPESKSSESSKQAKRLDRLMTEKLVEDNPALGQMWEQVEEFKNDPARWAGDVVLRDFFGQTEFSEKGESKHIFENIKEYLSNDGSITDLVTKDLSELDVGEQRDFEKGLYSLGRVLGLQYENAKDPAGETFKALGERIELTALARMASHSEEDSGVTKEFDRRFQDLQKAKDVSKGFIDFITYTAEGKQDAENLDETKAIPEMQEKQAKLAMTETPVLRETETRVLPDQKQGETGPTESKKEMSPRLRKFLKSVEKTKDAPEEPSAAKNEKVIEPGTRWHLKIAEKRNTEEAQKRKDHLQRLLLSSSPDDKESRSVRKNMWTLIEKDIVKHEDNPRSVFTRKLMETGSADAKIRLKRVVELAHKFNENGLGALNVNEMTMPELRTLRLLGLGYLEAGYDGNKQHPFKEMSPVRKRAVRMGEIMGLTAEGEMIRRMIRGGNLEKEKAAQAHKRYSSYIKNKDIPDEYLEYFQNIDNLLTQKFNFPEVEATVTEDHKEEEPTRDIHSASRWWLSGKQPEKQPEPKEPTRDLHSASRWWALGRKEKPEIGPDVNEGDALPGTEKTDELSERINQTLSEKSYSNYELWAMKNPDLAEQFQKRHGAQAGAYWHELQRDTVPIAATVPQVPSAPEIGNLGDINGEVINQVKTMANGGVYENYGAWAKDNPELAKALSDVATKEGKIGAQLWNELRGGKAAEAVAQQPSATTKKSPATPEPQKTKNKEKKKAPKTEPIFEGKGLYGRDRRTMGMLRTQYKENKENWRADYADDPERWIKDSGEDDQDVKNLRSIVSSTGLSLDEVWKAILEGKA